MWQSRRDLARQIEYCLWDDLHRIRRLLRRRRWVSVRKVSDRIGYDPAANAEEEAVRWKRSRHDHTLFSL